MTSVTFQFLIEFPFSIPEGEYPGVGFVLYSPGGAYDTTTATFVSLPSGSSAREWEDYLQGPLEMMPGAATAKVSITADILRVELTPADGYKITGLTFHMGDNLLTGSFLTFDRGADLNPDLTFETGDAVDITLPAVNLREPETWLQSQIRLANTELGDEDYPLYQQAAADRDTALSIAYSEDGGKSHLQEVITSGSGTGRLDAGDLAIGGGIELPAGEDNLHRSSYNLYFDADGGSFSLRFDDAVTDALPITATAAQLTGALLGLDGITSAEVSGGDGDFTIAITANEPHALAWSDLHLDGDGGLDYLMA